jgi:molybdate transport system regulatory protein
MRLSIRNRLDGVVAAVTRGEVMGTVRVRLSGGQDVIAAITLDAIDDLGLEKGTAVTVLIKTTEVAVATGALARISIRNQFPGTVAGVEHGTVMTTVKIEISGGEHLMAAITRDGAEDLVLAEGDAVTALVKSTEVSIATS